MQQERPTKHGAFIMLECRFVGSLILVKIYKSFYIEFFACITFYWVHAECFMIFCSVILRSKVG